MSNLVAVVRRLLPAGILALAVTSPALGQGCLCGTLADEFRAADAGLVREWIVQTPFNSATARLEAVAVGDGLVIVQSGDGGVHAIRTTTGPDGRAGTVAWSRSIGAAVGHAWPPTVGSRLVVVASDLAVHALDRETGDVEWDRPTGSLTAAPAVQSGGWVYAPLQTNRLLRLPVNPLGAADGSTATPNADTPNAAEPAATADPNAADPNAAGRDAAQPPAATPPAESLDPVSIDAGGSLDAAPIPLGTGVLWTSANGLVVLEPTSLGWVRHQLPETGSPSWAQQSPLALAGPPAVRGNSIFIATQTDGVARVELNAPKRPGLRTTWAATLPDRATSGPFVSGDTVVVATGASGIVALAADDGRELWRSDLAGTLVAVAGGRAWILDTVGRLTAIDLATGSRLQSFCLGCLTLPVVNPGAERLLLASPGGLIVSLAPPVAPPAPATAPPPVTAPDAPPPAAGPADPGATPP